MGTISKINWPEFGGVLPQRDDPVAGKAAERCMETEAGGMGGTRRVDRVDADGTTHILNTRKGNPVIRVKKKAGSTSGGETLAVRGFVAHVPGSTKAARFSPYTLAVSDPAYKIFKNTYTVLPFATTYNVPSGDVTNWLDVASFYATKILINGKEMSLLKTTSIPAGAYIPWIIPHTGTGLDKYGDNTSNTYEKRVFAVGRYQVKSWAGATATLLPAEARTNAKALTVGQRIDTTLNAAYLGQLFSYPYDNLWDDLVAEWYWSSAKVNMTLASPYLTKTDSAGGCAMPYAWLENRGASSGSMATPTTLPATALWLKGAGHAGGTAPATRVIYWPWEGTESAPMQGSVNASYSRIAYSASASSIISGSGYALTFTGSNIKNFDVRSESTTVIAQTIELLPAVSNTTEELANANETTIFWPAADPPPYRGRTAHYTDGGTIGGSSISRNYNDQSANFSVVSSSGLLVSVAFEKHLSYGPATSFTPDNTYYDGYLAVPNGFIGVTSGIGIYSRVLLTYHFNPSTDKIEIYDTYKQNPNPPPQQTADVIAEIEASFDDRRAKYLAQTMYDNENSSGFNGHSTYYYCSVSSRTDSSVTLNWTTTDYILHDVENGVFISINAVFEGVDTAANLTVKLKVKTRYGEAIMDLATFYYSYGEMLPEKTLDSSGRTAVPSPRIRAMFAPLYQEQGSFKGAHYVTLAEEANGAAPAHLFNFNLYLQGYGDVGTCNASNAAFEGVYFVPCNLLEMLYAYVFSSKYGVDDYQRYPVDNTDRYNTMMTTLFSTGIRIECRDGVFSDWLSPFSGEYATSKTTELTRI